MWWAEAGGQKRCTAPALQQKAASRQMETLLREEKNQLIQKMTSLKKLVAAQRAQIAKESEANDALQDAMLKLQEENQALTGRVDRCLFRVFCFTENVSLNHASPIRAPGAGAGFIERVSKDLYRSQA